RKGFWGRLFGGETEEAEKREDLPETETPAAPAAPAPDFDAQTTHDEVIDEQNIDVHVPDDILPEDLREDEIDSAEPEKGVEENRSWFSRLTFGLSRSSNQLTGGIT